MPPKIEASSSIQLEGPAPQQHQKIVAYYRRSAVWFKTVFLRRKDYVPGDTCRFIWQTVPDVQRGFVYYRIGHMLGNLIVFCISFFHITGPYMKNFCEKEPAVFCLGSVIRLQFEWLFYATSIGIMFNLVQSIWGLALTLRTYCLQKRALKTAKDVENREGVEHVDAQKKGKSLDHQEMPKMPVVHSINAPSDRSQKSAKETEILVESKVSIRLIDSKSSDRKKKKDIKHSSDLDGQKSSQKNANLVKHSKDGKDSTGPIPESGANPSATKEHNILSKTGFYWGLHSYSVSASVLIDIVYWTLIWPRLSTSPVLYFNQINEHGLNLPLMIADYCVVAFPVNMSHMWFTFVISFCYVILNCIYYLAGGKNDDRTKHYLYSFLDWKKPGKSLAFGFFITLSVCMILLIILVIDHYKFKCRPTVLLNTTQNPPESPRILQS